MTTIRRKVIATFTAATFVSAVVALGPTAATAASPYDRPNAMTCVANTLIVDAPTNVPVAGPVLWQVEMQTRNTVTGNWERAYLSPQYTNMADQVYITAGPWLDADNNTVFSVLGSIPDGYGPVETRAYNHFWQLVGNEWIYVEGGGWYSTTNGTATGSNTCFLDARPITV